MSLTDDQWRDLLRRAHVHHSGCYGRYEPCGEHHAHDDRCGDRPLVCGAREDALLVAVLDELRDLRTRCAADANLRISSERRGDALYAAMQTPGFKERVDAAFHASPKEIGRAAVEAAWRLPDEQLVHYHERVARDEDLDSYTADYVLTELRERRAQDLTPAEVEALRDVRQEVRHHWCLSDERHERAFGVLDRLISDNTSRKEAE